MNENEIRETLESEKARLEAMRIDLRESAELDDDPRNGSGGELSSQDQHDADVASDVVGREVTLSQIEQIEAQLDDVEHAMQKLQDGTYGKSELSGEPIDPERLKAFPATRYTMEEQKMVEQDAALNSTVDANGNSDVII